MSDEWKNYNNQKLRELELSRMALQQSNRHQEEIARSESRRLDVERQRLHIEELTEAM